MIKIGNPFSRCWNWQNQIDCFTAFSVSFRFCVNISGDLNYENLQGVCAVFCLKKIWVPLSQNDSLMYAVVYFGVCFGVLVCVFILMRCT